MSSQTPRCSWCTAGILTIIDLYPLVPFNRAERHPFPNKDFFRSSQLRIRHPKHVFRSWNWIRESNGSVSVKNCPIIIFLLLLFSTLKVHFSQRGSLIFFYRKSTCVRETSGCLSCDKQSEVSSFFHFWKRKSAILFKQGTKLRFESFVVYSYAVPSNQIKSF